MKIVQIAPKNTCFFSRKGVKQTIVTVMSQIFTTFAFRKQNIFLKNVKKNGADFLSAPLNVNQLLCLFYLQVQDTFVLVPYILLKCYKCLSLYYEDFLASWQEHQDFQPNM